MSETQGQSHSKVNLKEIYKRQTAVFLRMEKWIEWGGHESCHFNAL